MSNDNMLVENAEELGYREAPYQERPSPRSAPIMDASQSAALTPQVLALLLSAAIKRCWKWALFFGLILAFIGAAVVYVFFPIRYEATAMVEVKSTADRFLFQEVERQNAYEALVATQFELIRSPEIITEVLRNSEVAQISRMQKELDKVAWLSKNIRLTQKGKSDYFTISFQDENADRALAVVKTILEVYFAKYEARLQSQGISMHKLLSEEKGRRSESVKRLETEINKLMKSAASKGGSFSQTTLMGGFNPEESISKDYILANAKLRSLQVELEVAKNFKVEDDDIPDVLIRDAIADDMMYGQYLTNIQLLRVKIESKRKAIQQNDMTLVGMENDLRNLEAEADLYAKQLQSSKRQEIAERLKLEAQKGIWEKESMLQAQEIFVKKLKEEADSQTTNVQDRTEDTARIASMSAELARESKILDMLSERLVAVETEQRAPTRIRRLTDPTRPVEPNTKMLIPMAVVVGGGLFLAPFFLGVVVERLKPRLYHVSQIRKAIPGIIIGEIMEPPVAWVQGTTFRRRLARYRESVHNWCTHLLLADPFRQCQTLAVASVAGDDGKTFLAIQVAAAMAQMKSGPVLLIDGDMRVGRLHLLFGNEEPGPGLADVLSFRKGIGEAIVLNEKEPNLHLLSAGELDVSPYELLGDGRFRELLDTLATHYSMIMVVVPPVAHAAEALMMAASVDSVILCVRQGTTVLAAMEDVYRKLINTGSHVDGVVVKDIPYYQMAGKDGGFNDKIEQIRLAHLLQHTEE